MESILIITFHYSLGTLELKGGIYISMSLSF